jgi:hypothetical protein
MFARNVYLHLKPISVAEFTQTIEKEIAMKCVQLTDLQRAGRDTGYTPLTDPSYAAFCVNLLRMAAARLTVGAGIVVTLVLLASAGAALAEPARNSGTCKPGFVWREAFSGDKVCVTPQTRAEAAADNQQAASRRQPNGGDNCKSGYVWREARPGDLVCVTPQTRAQTAADNGQANQRQLLEDTVLIPQPSTGPSPFGSPPPPRNSGTCKPGFVWREAFSGDKVCVTPQTRAEAAADNQQAASRRQPNGGDNCKSGYVWREARPGDLVCVTPQTRAQTAADNGQANQR